jgi:hypothetical protein
VAYGTVATDFPEVEKQIRDGKLLFSEYTGENPVGLVATSILSRQNAPTGGISDFKIPPGLNWQSFNNGGDSKRFQWASIYDKNRLCIIVKESEGKSDISSLLSDLTIRIQPRRLWPSKRFQFKMKTSDPKKNVKIISSKGTSWVLVQIPWNDIGADRDTSRIRVDVQVNEKSGGVIGWCELKPATPRLEHGTDNPDDFGWLILGKRN